MTTPIVPSISDEQLAELEQMASHEFFSDDNDASVMFGELRGLIARLRAAEADAKRYRWLRDQNESLRSDAFVVLSQDCPADEGLRHWVGACLDTAVDSAMEPKP